MEGMAVDYKPLETELLKNAVISFLLIKTLTRILVVPDNIISRNLTMNSTSKVSRFIYENEDHFMQLK